jgi:hypothetical protein
MAFFKSLMTALTVSGAFFFIMANPRSMTPRCYVWSVVPRYFCTASTVCFWTYPVFCFLLSASLFKRYLIDARTYYEFVLHEVAVVYPSLSITQSLLRPGLPSLFVYTLLALTSIIWKSATADLEIVGHASASLAYLAPILSFVSVVVLNWSVEGNIITLPVFLASHDPAVALLRATRPYSMEDLGKAYDALEKDLEGTETELTTSRLVRLLEEKIRGGTAATTPRRLATCCQNCCSWRSWNERMLTSNHLQDERSRTFKTCAKVYTAYQIICLTVGCLLFFCTAITALKLTHAIDVQDPAWQWAARFALSRDVAEDVQDPGVEVSVAARTRKFLGAGGDTAAFLRVAP